MVYSVILHNIDNTNISIHKLTEYGVKIPYIINPGEMKFITHLDYRLINIPIYIVMDTKLYPIPRQTSMMFIVHIK